MVNVRELRLSNYITDAEGRITLVNRLHYNGADNITVNGKHPDYFSPIHLTEEILLKCGFVDGVKQHGFFEFSKQGDCVAWGINDDDSGKFILIDNGLIKNLHQLQNLFFDLTDVELDVSSLP